MPVATFSMAGCVSNWPCHRQRLANCVHNHGDRRRSGHSRRHSRRIQLVRINQWRPDREVTGTSALRSEIWVPVDGLRQPDVGAWRPDLFVSPIARFCAAAQVPSRAQNNECRTTQIWRGRIVLSSILYESIIRAVEWSVSTQQPHQPCGVLGAHLGTPKHSTGSADDPSHLAPEFSCGRLRR